MEQEAGAGSLIRLPVSMGALDRRPGRRNSLQLRDLRYPGNPRCSSANPELAEAGDSSHHSPADLYRSLPGASENRKAHAGALKVRRVRILREATLDRR